MIISLKLLMRNVMVLNSINLMVQAEFSPVNCPLSKKKMHLFYLAPIKALIKTGILLNQIEIRFDVSFN